MHIADDDGDGELFVEGIHYGDDDTMFLWMMMILR